MMYIDGSFGEGGGQILRTSLSLSLVTRKAFTMTNIRSGRRKPGLLRQHLTAVNAAKEIGDAVVKGNAIGSLSLTFEPKKINAGDYHFCVGTAGSATLVLQTVFPALIFGRSSSTIVVQGGTHNPFAPPFDFLKNCYVSCLTKMGVTSSCELITYGFYPAGGGEILCEINPVKKLLPIDIMQKGVEKKREVIGIVSDLPYKIADKEVAYVLSEIGWDSSEGRAFTVDSPGPGNIVFAELGYENICELFTGFGQRGVPLEQVGDEVVQQIKEYTKSDVPVGRYLSDQLLIPFALAGKGRFRTCALSKHTLTNIEIIKKFLPVTIETINPEKNVWEIDVKGEAYEVD